VHTIYLNGLAPLAAERPWLGPRNARLDRSVLQWECKGMTRRAKSVLDAFDSLSAEERQEVLAELFRRAARSDHETSSDEELIAAAGNVFLELDRDESQT